MQASYWIYLLHPFVMYWGQSLMHGLQLEFLVTHMRTQMPIVCFFVILTAAYLGSLCVYAMLRLCQKILIHIEKLPGDLKKSQSRSSLNDIQTKEMKQP